MIGALANKVVAKQYARAMDARAVGRHLASSPSLRDEMMRDIWSLRGLAHPVNGPQSPSMRLPLTSSPFDHAPRGSNKGGGKVSGKLVHRCDAASLKPS